MSQEQQSTIREVPAIIQAWIGQLLDDKFVELVLTQPYERIDIRLASSRGRVSKAPMVTLNGGQHEFVEL